MDQATLEGLKKRLRNGKLVQIEDSDGKIIDIRIGRVPLQTWDPADLWYSELQYNDEDKWLEKLGQIIAAPDESVKRAVLLRGVLDPKVKGQDEDGAICVDDLLRDDILSLNIYRQIADFTWSRLNGKEQAREDGERRNYTKGR